MATKDRRTVLIGALLTTLFAGLQPIPAYASFWDDLWKTPHQQNVELEQEGEFEALTENESSPAWSGVGHYRNGDYAQAAEKFASSADSFATYNQATALTQAGQYDEAVKLFDQILTENPADEKAAHNRSIADQLAKLQQQQQQQDGDGQDGENQDGDKQDGDKQDGEQQESGQQNSDQQDSDGDTEQEQEGQSGSDQEQQQQQDQQTANEQQNEQSDSDREEEQQQSESGTSEEPTPTEETANENQQIQPSNEAMTENEQATEQWLRRIPDDPTGLLRRKLQRSHATDFPGVVDGASPW